MTNLNFSGHETFPLRQLWPFKASELLKSYKSPFTKDRVHSMMDMGLGANMLKSMSFWLQSSQLIKGNNQGEYQLQPLGETILNSKNGDPFFERLETLWIIHQKLAVNKSKNSSIYWLFNKNNNIEFSYADFVRGVHNWYEHDELNMDTFPSKETLKKDFNVSIGMYTQKSKMDSFDDSVQYPFWSLGLIKNSPGQKSNFQMVKRSVCDIPKNVFYYTLIEYLNITEQYEAVSFDKLLNDVSSPGRVLMLTEHPLRVYLETVEEDLNGEYVFDDTAGQRILYIKSRLDGIDFVRNMVYC